MDMCLINLTNTNVTTSRKMNCLEENKEYFLFFEDFCVFSEISQTISTFLIGLILFSLYKTLLLAEGNFQPIIMVIQVMWNS